MAEDSDEMLATLRWRSENFPGQTHGADLVSAWALGEIEQLRADLTEQAETIERLRHQVELLNAHPPLLVDAAGTVTPLLGAIGIALSQETPATKDPCNDHICAKCGWHFGIADRDIEIQL